MTPAYTLSDHLLHQAIYDLCQEVEKLPPSEHATKLVTMAGALQLPVADLRAELAKANQDIANHAEDWAMCDIPHDGQLAKNLVLSDTNHKLKAALSAAEAECAELRRQVADLKGALAITHRSADDQMQQKRDSKQQLEELYLEHERLKLSLIRILSNTDAVNATTHKTVPEMMACMAMKMLHETTNDAKQLCEHIDHADPAAWNNGNTRPDHAGTDEGAVLAANHYSALRAKYRE
jgi:chromosome segregation ATPase